MTPTYVCPVHGEIKKPKQSFLHSTQGYINFMGQYVEHKVVTGHKVCPTCGAECEEKE